ncbi:MAG TPA: ATP-binding cassette domain-containing protein [Acidimicrobiales bacterium]|nr:ATP-binding cassette domain-containing protein [Acidimicrobiales bacterium]
MSDVLEVIDLHRSFGGLRAVDGVSFSVREGEVLAIIGPNGAGKTTVFNLLAGRLRPSHGRIVLDRANVTQHSVRGRVHRGVVATFQIPRIMAGLTVGEVLRAALHYGAGVRRPDAEIGALCQQFDLRGAELVATLDLHHLKILEMCRAVAVRPRVLLLDEVAAGLDETERDQIAAKVKELAASGTAIVVVEHSMDFIRRVAQRALVLSFGRVIACGAVEEVLADEHVIAAYLGRVDVPA